MSDAWGLRPLTELAVDDPLIWGLVDSLPDGIVVVDEAGWILLVNRQTCLLYTSPSPRD